MLQLNHQACIDCGAATLRGTRPANEDAVYICPADAARTRRGRLFAVADGMGGHRGGGLASRMAIHGLQDYYRHPIHGRSPLPPRHLKRHLEQTILRTDRQIRYQGSLQPALADMGATLSCLVATPSHTIIAHVGDTRIYRWRRGHLTRLTTDHTFVQEMIFEGEIDAAAAGSHPLRHVLTRVVGTSEPLEWVDTRIDPLEWGDRFLICSDGLHGSPAAKRIAWVLQNRWPARRMAATLVADALQCGATDNITAVVINNDRYGPSTNERA